MTKKKENNGSTFLTKLGVGAALGAAAFFILKNDKLNVKNQKNISTDNQKEEMFI